MNDDRHFEPLLSDALRRRGEPAPFSIDVAERVMARVSAIGAPPRTDLAFGQFARWAVAASLIGLALTAAAFWHGPSLEGVIFNLGSTAADSAGAALKLRTPAETLVGALGRVALALFASARVLLQSLERFRPLAQASLAATVAIMLVITTLIVGRDVRARTVEKEHS
jgi:hypothetical protein